MNLKFLNFIYIAVLCSASRYSSYLMDITPLKVFAYYIPNYQTKDDSGGWEGWNIFGHNPDQSRDTFKHDIASARYPYLGPYSANDKDYIEYQAQLMKIVGIDGVAIDVSTYSQRAAGHIKVLVEQLKNYNLSAFLVYHDNDRFYLGGTIRSNITTVIYDDITKWLDLIKDVQLFIGYRPLLGLFSASGDPNLVEDETDPTLTADEPRLLPSEIKSWTSTYSTTTRPVIISQLFGKGYNEILNGKLEWVIPTTKTDATFKYVNEARHEMISAVSESMRELRITYHVTTLWPGYDDSQVNGWGNSPRYLPFDEGKTYEFLWSSVMNVSSPLVLIDSWNNWWNGTAIEPSLEDEYKHLEITQNYTAQFKGQKNEALMDMKVPEILLMLKRNTDPKYQEVGLAIAQLIKDKEYLAAEILARYYANVLGLQKDELSSGMMLSGVAGLILTLLFILL